MDVWYYYTISNNVAIVSIQIYSAMHGCKCAMGFHKNLNSTELQW